MNDILYCPHVHIDLEENLCIDCYQNIKEEE